ncbi:OstA-like protein [Aridibaculum aurantiacum]|uniref:OstA-like protein n=1 Tax=Aridibaculum aurantiacum TaxID=2810307 RepID=UPI001A964E03|nr:OstA-like protein [Aridibaculum aurantiacum]
MQKKFVPFFLFLLLASFAKTGLAQVPGDTTRRIDIIIADRYNYQKVEGVGDLISLAGNVRLRQGKTLFYCDSAVVHQAANTLEAFGNIHINDADSVHTYAQYLKYFGQTKLAVLKNKVRLTDGKAVLTTNDLEYNTATHIGNYVNGGRVVNGKTVLTSTEADYYGETRDIIFRKKVVLTDPSYKVNTDTLLYNTYTEIARFLSPTTIVTDGRTVKTSEGYYDLRNKTAEFGKRPVVDDKDYNITADRLAFDNASGFSDALGNVVYKTKDTANTSVILANRLQANNKTGAVLATQKPLMIIKQGRDSIYIAADTLYTAKLTDLEKERPVPNIFDSAFGVKPPVVNTKDSSNNRFIEAYYNVRIFSDSMQAVGDSMFYSFRDSAFRLFKSPVVWSQENQVTGDTIYLYTHQQKPQKFFAFENAIAISKAQKDLFNQVKGTTIQGDFKEGRIDFFSARGSAENIYYATDEDSSFLGVNRSTSDVIDVYFKDQKPHKVVLRNNLQGTIYPMRQVNHGEMRVRGFQWYEDRRPKTKFELFGQ